MFRGRRLASHELYSLASFCPLSRRKTPDTICSAVWWPSDHWLARGPATFNTIVIPSECEGPLNWPVRLRRLERFLVLCATWNDSALTNSVAASIVSWTLILTQSITKYGFPISIQRSTVSRVPPTGSPFEMINVPSESATFLAVRAAYPAFANSTTG